MAASLPALGNLSPNPDWAAFEYAPSESVQGVVQE